MSAKPANPKRFLANPGGRYRPSAPTVSSYASHLLDGTPVFTWFDIPRMLHDPRIQLGIRTLCSPFQQVQFRFHADQHAVELFVEHTLKRFWRRMTPMLLQRYFIWGFGAGVNEFKASRRQIRFWRGKSVEGRDATPRIWSKGPDQGRFAGFDLKADRGSEWVSQPHAIWFAGQQQMGALYDRPRLAGAFAPWLEKRGRNGAIDSRRLWYRKCAFNGGTLYHPPGQTNVGTDDVPNLRDNQTIARELLEYAENSSVFTFENTPNASDSGKYAWDFRPAESHADIAGVRDYPKDLDQEILEGLGIPPEIIDAAQTGSGWSGRMIPAMSFFGAMDELVGLLVDCVEDSFLRELVRQNFGHTRYEIEPIPLVETILNPSGQAQQPPPSGRPVAQQPPGGSSDNATAQPPPVESTPPDTQTSDLLSFTDPTPAHPMDVIGRAVLDSLGIHEANLSYTESEHPRDAHGEWEPKGETPSAVRRHPQVVAAAKKLAASAQSIASRMNEAMLQAGLTPEDVVGDQANWERIFVTSHADAVSHHLGVDAMTAAHILSHLVAHALGHVKHHLKRPVHLSHGGAEHAPKGGITIGGKEFVGGEFIPASVVAQATPEERAQLEAKTAGKSPAKSARSKARPDKPHATRGEMTSATRQGAGPNARIVLANGQAAPPHIKPSMVPPQWTQVQVSLDPNADLQVTGRDAKGRAKAVYRDAFHMKTAAIKFARVQEGLAKAQSMAQQNQANRANPALREMADCVWLMQEQATRPGSDKDTGGAVKAYGATTLEGRHVVRTPEGVRLRFIGKEGVAHDHLIRNPDLARMLLRRAKAAGAKGKLFRTNYAQVADYTKSKLDGGKFTPKDFRTMRATQLAIDAVNADVPPSTEKEYKQAVKRVAEKVSAVLGNRPQQALESYIAPEVFSGWRAGLGQKTAQGQQNSTPTQDDAGTQIHRRLNGPDAVPETPSTQTPPTTPDAQHAADQWLAGAHHLPAELKEAYHGHLTHALSKMPAPARKMAVDAVSRGGAMFYPDVAGVTQAAASITGRRERGVCGFVRSKAGGAVELHLDSGSETDPKAQYAARGTYAHELWHAVDADRFYSDKPKWQSAYKKDIIKGRTLLSRYAMESPTEGFAELGRVLQEKGADHIQAHYPNCYKFLEAEKLL